jgi:hypothetical protein
LATSCRALRGVAYGPNKGLDSEYNPFWYENNCNENNRHVFIGKESYFVSTDGYLMPIKKPQPPPNLKYFKGAPPALPATPATPATPARQPAGRQISLEPGAQMR